MQQPTLGGFKIARDCFDLPQDAFFFFYFLEPSQTSGANALLRPTVAYTGSSYPERHFLYPLAIREQRERSASAFPATRQWTRLFSPIRAVRSIGPLYRLTSLFAFVNSSVHVRWTQPCQNAEHVYHAWPLTTKALLVSLQERFVIYMVH